MAEVGIGEYGIWREEAKTIARGKGVQLPESWTLFKFYHLGITPEELIIIETEGWLEEGDAEANACVVA